MGGIREKFTRFHKREFFIFFIISVLFGIIMYPIEIAGDDIGVWKSSGYTITEWWNWAIAQYYTWSSRQLINFVWTVVLHSGRGIWVLYMTISMYVMMKAMSLLFGVKSENKQRVNRYIACILLWFPFGILASAGWIATATSYFGPQAFALMSLVPIRKVYDGEKINLIEFSLYCLCLIYGTNAEQMSVVVFMIYFVALIYFGIRKKSDWKIVFLFVLSIASLIYMFTCPGNFNRDIAETATWFPTYNMLDMVDKIDIGLSTTLKWMFVDSNAFIIIICFEFMYFVWKRYKEPLFRFIAVIPTVATVLLGPLRNITVTIFPYITYILNGVNYYGSFNVENEGKGYGVIQFAMFLIIAGCICIEIILLNDRIEGLITDLVLVIAGVASRVAMGFSPTVYASSDRTYSTLIVCIMAVSVHVYAINVGAEYTDFDEKEKYVQYGLMLLNILNLAVMVSVLFH